MTKSEQSTGLGVAGVAGERLLPPVTIPIAGLVRPIIGIEHRTADEVFEIMVDRISRALASAVSAPSMTPEPGREALAAIVAGEPVTPESVWTALQGRIFLSGHQETLRQSFNFVLSVALASQAAQLAKVEARATTAEARAEAAEAERDIAQRLTNAAIEDYNDALARVAVLEEALKPFAEILGDYDPDDEDDETPGTFVAGSVVNYDLTLGDLRRARNALKRGTQHADQ